MSRPPARFSSPRLEPEVPSRLAWVLGCVAVLVLAGILGAHTVGELDIWLHQRVGSDLLDGAGFAHDNTYSFTATRYPWTNHEWLFQVVAALTGPDLAENSLAGKAPEGPSVALWVILRMGLTLGLLLVFLLGDGRLSRLRGNATDKMSSPWIFPVVLLGLLLLWPRLNLRPELISYILFIPMVRLAQKATRWGQGEPSWRPSRALIQAVLITWLWAQCHGFSALAPLLWILGGLTHGLENRLGWGGREPVQWKPGLLGWALLMLALLLTPNGLAGWTYPLKALGQFVGPGPDLQRTISELTPLLTSRDTLDLTILAFEISLAWGLIWVVLQWRKLSLLRVLLWLVAAWATFQAQRNIGFYSLTFLLLHSDPQSGGLTWPWPRPARRLPDRAGRIASLGLTLTLAGWFAVHLLNNGFYLHEGVSRRTGLSLTPARFSWAAAAQVRGHQPQNLVTNLDGAAFLLAATGRPLFIDGRTEAYPPRLWHQYEQLKRGGAEALDLLGDVGPTQVYVTQTNPAFRALTRTLLAAPHWQLQFADETGLLFRPHGPGVAPTTNGERLTAFVQGLSSERGRAGGTVWADLCLARANLAALAAAPTAQESWLKQGLAAQPDHPTLAHNMGNVLLARGDFPAALSRFQTALQANPRLAGSALNAGVCLLNRNQPEGAADYFKRATTLQPGNFEGWVNLGVARQRQGETEAAVTAFEKALTLNPRHEGVRRALAELRGQIRRPG